MENISFIRCGGDTADKNTIANIREQMSEKTSEAIIIDLTDIKTIEPSFIREMNAIAARADEKIILIVPDFKLRSKLIGLALNAKIDLCKSEQQAENELAERTTDIDELKRQVRRGIYNR